MSGGGGSGSVSARRFYSEYHGHQIDDLRVLYPRLRDSCDSLIWTAGDSSLDNKYWFADPRPAVGAYRDVLQPPTSNADVVYWIKWQLGFGLPPNAQAAGRASPTEMRFDDQGRAWILDVSSGQWRRLGALAGFLVHLIIELYYHVVILSYYHMINLSYYHFIILSYL